MHAFFISLHWNFLPCRWWQLPYYWVGIKLYDIVAGSQCLKSSYVLSKSRALELFPMLRKDKLVGAIVYYDGTFPSSAFIITLCCLGAGGMGGQHLCSYTDSAKGSSTAQSIHFASEFLSVKWAPTLLTTVTYGMYKRTYLFSWLVGTVICESLLVFW